MNDIQTELKDFLISFYPLSDTQIDQIATYFLYAKRSNVVYFDNQKDVQMWRWGDYWIAKKQNSLLYRYSPATTPSNQSFSTLPNLSDLILDILNEDWDAALVTAGADSFVKPGWASHWFAPIPSPLKHLFAGNRIRQSLDVFHNLIRALPSEVQLAVRQTKLRNLDCINWLLEAGSGLACLYRCQALQQQPYWLPLVITTRATTVSVPRNGSFRLAYDALLWNIEAGRSWQTSLRNALVRLGRLIYTADGPSLLANPQTTERVVSFSHSKLGIPTRSSLLNPRVLVMGSHLSSRQPKDPRDWRALSSLIKLLPLTPPAFLESSLTGCPAKLSDIPLHNAAEVEIARNCLRCSNSPDPEIRRWLISLGRTEGGLTRDGRWLSYDQVIGALAVLTFQQWTKLSKLCPKLYTRAKQVLKLHPLAVVGGKSTTYSWNTPSPFTTSNGLQGVWLKDSAALQEESTTMQHCVGGDTYVKACLMGSSRILSIRRRGTPIATAEIAFTSGTPFLAQIYGPKDSIPTSEAVQIARESISKIAGEPPPTPVAGSKKLIRAIHKGKFVEALHRAAVDAWVANALWYEARRHPVVDQAILENVSQTQKLHLKLKHLLGWIKILGNYSGAALLPAVAWQRFRFERSKP